MKGKVMGQQRACGVVNSRHIAAGGDCFLNLSNHSKNVFSSISYDNTYLKQRPFIILP